MDTPEIWKKVRNWPYQVSNLGRVRRIRADSGTRVGMLIQPFRTKYGYCGITLHNGGEHYRTTVHVLVCKAFHGRKPSPIHQVAHNDGNKSNNLSKNLRWSTAKENQNDRRRHGTWIQGEKHGNAKLKTADVIAIRRIPLRSPDLAPLCKKLGISYAYACRVRKGGTWSHVTLDEVRARAAIR